MKIITEIKQVGKSEKYKLFLNDEFEFFVSLDVIYKNSLKKGQEISEELCKEIKFESDSFFAFNMAINIMNTTLKTKNQLDQYLFKKGFDKIVRQNTIEKIESYGYINDKEYADLYIEKSKKSKGANLIKQQLLQKGINKNIIDEALKGLSQEDELDTLARKFLKNKEKSDSTKQKLYRHLISKGFNYSEVMSVVSRFFSGDDYDWN